MRSADKEAVTWVMLARLVIAALGLCAVSAHAMPPGEDLQERIIEISERVKPSVVHIEAIVRVNDRRNQVTGSGLIASESGLILTNQHVVERSEKVEVSVPGRKKRYPATILGTDKQTDIAVLQIQPEGALPAAVFGSIDEVRVGQWVLAIGNPYGLDGTVSFGIVSAKGRNLEIPDLINDFIQTDAMIDRGSSGGPLVDLDGRVIGINSRGQGRGIGFTIPIDTALEVGPDPARRHRARLARTHDPTSEPRPGQLLRLPRGNRRDRERSAPRLSGGAGKARGRRRHHDDERGLGRGGEGRGSRQLPAQGGTRVAR